MSGACHRTGVLSGERSPCRVPCGIHNYENIAGVRDNDYLTPVGQTIEDGSTNKKKGKCNKK